MALTRISLTIPFALLRELDKRAKALDRSRSRVVAEAVRQYLTAQGAPPTTVVRESENSAPYTVTQGLGPHRQQQLVADLKLTPTERVLAAEESARIAPRRRPPVPHRVIQFDRFEDFFAWQRADDLTS